MGARTLGGSHYLVKERDGNNFGHPDGSFDRYLIVGSPLSLYYRRFKSCLLTVLVLHDTGYKEKNCFNGSNSQITHSKNQTPSDP